MKNFIIILIAIVSCGTNKYNISGTYVSSSNMLKNIVLKFYDNGKFSLSYNMDFQDSINNKGNYKIIEDTLIISTINKPDYYDLIDVEEKICSTEDSLIVEIINKGDPEFYPPASTIEINGKFYDAMKHIGLFGIKEVNSILVHDSGFDYPIYLPKNKRSNFFKITLKKPNSSKNYTFYPNNSYFINKKFLVKGDTLFCLDNDIVNNKCYYIKMGNI